MSNPLYTLATVLLLFLLSIVLSYALGRVDEAQAQRRNRALNDAGALLARKANSWEKSK